MLLELIYIQRVMEATGSLWNVIETYGREQKVMEGDRRLWNLMEISRKREIVP